jgi:ABC-type polysaccharide/polyol phosphate transport system ATPase subunit
MTREETRRNAIVTFPELEEFIDTSVRRYSSVAAAGVVRRYMARNARVR